ncbi:hypothetical protein MA9V1_026 [Chryseobacterium phage MA9V-1]|nr:hypothetical protein MA9V1_026 [Chryseobacterium phage MA9V-1]
MANVTLTKFAIDIEKERKFLLKPEAFLPKTFSVPKFIQQVYLVVDSEYTGDHTRIRITDWKHAEITYKKVIDKETREEYDFEIDLSKAMEIYAKSNFKLEKKRYTRLIWPVGSSRPQGEYAVDIYPDGTMIVEIEYFTQELYDLHQDEKELPAFCGKEITGMKAFSNINLANIMENQHYDHSVKHEFGE